MIRHPSVCPNPWLVIGLWVGLLALALAAWLSAGCSAPAPTLYESPAASPGPTELQTKLALAQARQAVLAETAVPPQPRTFTIGWTPEGCRIVTNTVVHRSFTNCPLPPVDHIEVMLSDRLLRWTSSSPAARFAALQADLEGSTNLVQWYPLGTLRQGWPIVRPLGIREFYRLVNIKS